MKFCNIIGLSLGLAACTAPDLTTEIGEGRKLLAEIRTDTKPILEPLSKIEKTNADNRLILANKTVVELFGDCDTIAARDTPQVLSTCILNERSNPQSGAVNASATLQFLKILDAYFAGLERIATAGSVDDVKVQAQALVNAFGKPNDQRPAAFENLGNFVRGRETIIVQGAGFLLDQVRISQLRRAVRTADPILSQGFEIAAAYLESISPNLLKANEELHTAEKSVIDIRASGQPDLHRKAIENLRTKHAAFKAAEAKSPVIKILLLRNLHSALKDRLSNAGSIEEIVMLLEQIRVISDAAQQGNKS